MSDGLFYVDALPAVGEIAVLDGDEGFHAANVRRIRPGERLDLSDGAGDAGALRHRRGRQGQAVGARAGPAKRPGTDSTGHRRAGTAEVGPLGAGDRAGHRGRRGRVRARGRPRAVWPGGRGRHGSTRAFAAGPRWRGRPPDSRGVRTFPLSPARCRRPSWSGGSATTWRRVRWCSRCTSPPGPADRIAGEASRFAGVDRRARRRNRRRRDRRVDAKPARRRCGWARRCCGRRPLRPSRWARSGS